LFGNVSKIVSKICLEMFLKI